MTILAATVAVPLRTGPVFGWISSCTVPLPDPLAAFEIAIHDALLAPVHEQSGAVLTPTFDSLLDVVHAQPAAALTSTVPVPPLAPIV